MKKRNVMLLAMAVGALLMLAGCGNADKETADTPATQTEATTEVAETHDCAGGCGMMAVPADKMTEVAGKFYCAGCVAKAKAAAEETTDEHKGHSHG